MKNDRIIKDIIMDIKAKVKDPCPDDETLAAFIEGKLPEQRHREISLHFLTCPKCRDYVAAAWGQIPKRLRVPVEVIKKAAEILPAEESAWEVVVKFTSDFVEVIKNTGARTQYFAPAYASARSDRVCQSSLVAVSENIGGIETELEIERLDSGEGELKVNFKESGGIPNPPLRVTLKKNNKELESCIASRGSTVFEKVPIGAYDISISRKGISLGEITLEMKGE